MQAAFEYIKLWYKESQEQELVFSEGLKDDVKQVVKDTLDAASDSWWRYPSKEEADDGGEEFIEAYSKVSYEINLEEIWPEFKKLVEKEVGKVDQKL